MNKKIICIIMCLCTFTGCTTYKHYGYLQNIDKAQLEAYSELYEARIKKDDRLRITVFGPDSKVVMPYNLAFSDATSTSSGFSGGMNSYYTYLVDKDGMITFPIFGDIKVEGMTRRELERYLTEKIGKDVKDPLVMVSFSNYTINFLGAVNTSIRMETERISILQALAMAGGVDNNARRDNVLLIREVDGKPTSHRIDLRKAELLNDEYYWLQQNDIIYIQPGPIDDTSRTIAFWTSILGTIVTVTTMVLLLIK